MELSEPRALNRAAAYCSKAERCESDVRKKLVAWKASEESTERIIKRLKDEKFLSDERFCRSFINDKAKFNGWGKTKIAFELRRRNIKESVYQEFLDDIKNDEFEKKLLDILSKKIRTVKGKDDYERKTKLIRFAIGRGFAMNLAIKCANRIMGGDYDEFA